MDRYKAVSDAHPKNACVKTRGERKRQIKAQSYCRFHIFVHLYYAHYNYCPYSYLLSKNKLYIIKKPLLTHNYDNRGYISINNTLVFINTGAPLLSFKLQLHRAMKLRYSMPWIRHGLFIPAHSVSTNPRQQPVSLW